jgi:hypothetical protein
MMAPNRYGLSDEDYAYFLKTWREMKQHGWSKREWADLLKSVREFERKMKRHGLPKPEGADLSESMREFEAMGLIVIDEEGMVSLTEKGRNTDPDFFLTFYMETDKEQ